MKREKKVRKKIRKALCVLIAMTFTASGMVACGGSENKGKDVVQLYYWNAGYGIEWLNETVNNFNNNTAQYKVEIEESANQTTVTSTLMSGETNPYDLYITGLSSWSGTEPDMANLNDLLDSKYGTESKTLREKMNSYALRMREHNGEVRSLGISDAAVGLFYNAEMFAKYNLKEPKTTDELEDLAWEIQGKSDMKTSDGTKIAPFAHFKSSGNGYWKYVYEPWAVQYMGVDEYVNNFVKLKNANGENQKDVLYGNTATGADNTANDARYKVMQALERMLTKDTVHARSNEDSHTTMQTAFLSGQAAMMSSGSWLKNEMSVEDGSLNFRLMKTPVLSAITKTFEDKNMTDTELSAIIGAIDEEKSYEETKTSLNMPELSENDYNRIYEARGITYGSGANGGTHVFIPKYSDAKEAAKEFLRYLYSDEGIAIWMKYQHSPSWADFDDPSKADYSTWDEWDKSVSRVREQQTFSITGTLDQSRVFSENGRDMFVNVSIITKLTVNNPSDKLTADGIWTNMRKIIDDNWSTWMGA